MYKRYQVFISSTFTDLIEERKAIIESLLNANYIPAGMELFSASNDEQFEYIKKIIDNCDYYVLIVGARYGTINPTTNVSFTEQEYDYAVSKNIPVLVFLHSNPYDLPAKKRDDDKRKLLETFRNKVSKGRMCRMWDNKNDLITAVIISLARETVENPQLGWIRGSNYDLLPQINELKLDKEKLQLDANDVVAEFRSFEGNPNLEVDIFAYTGETIFQIIINFLKKLDETNCPFRSLSIRLLVKDLSSRSIIPCDENLKENINYRESTISLSQVHMTTFLGSLRSHQVRLGHKIEICFAPRIYKLEPFHKGIIINNQSAYWALYPIAKGVRKSNPETWDYRGLEANFCELKHGRSDVERKIIRSISEWFNIVWGGPFSKPVPDYEFHGAK